MAEESSIEQKYKEKESEVKFNDEEMSKLVEIRDKYLDVQQQFGRTAILKLRLEEQITDLNKRVDLLKDGYRKNQQTEQEFLDEVNKKYGEGELNPETGIFTPNKS